MIVDLSSFLRRYYLSQYLGHFHWFGYTDRDLPAVARLSKQQLKQVYNMAHNALNVFAHAGTYVYRWA